MKLAEGDGEGNKKGRCGSNWDHVSLLREGLEERDRPRPGRLVSIRWAGGESQDLVKD